MGRLRIKVALLSFAAGVALVSGGSAGAAIDSVSGQIELLPSPPASVQPGALSSETTMRAFDERQHVTLTASLSVNISQPGTYKLVSDETPAVIPAGMVVNSQFVHVDKNTQFSTVLTGTIHLDSDILGIVIDNAAAQWLDASDFLGFPTTLYPAPLLFGRGFELNTNQQDKIVVHADRRTVDITSDIRLQLVDQLRIITVGNAPPLVDAGPPASGAEGSAIALSGSVTDADSPGVTSQWSFAPLSGVDAGATCSFASPSSPTTTITCTDDGTYTATLTADDGTNPPVSNSTTVTVSNANPQVNIASPSAGPYTPGTPVSLSASFTDAGTNDTHVCTIDWGDGSGSLPGTISESNGSGTCTGSHTYSTAGSHAIVVMVTDDDGGSGQANVLLSNAAPIVSAGPPVSGAEGSAIALPGSVTDTDGPSDTIGWTYVPISGVDAGATCSFANASSPATTITCTDDGVYRATLTASDGISPPVSSSTNVTVSNANPQVTINAPTAGSYQAATPVALSASFTDAGGNDTHVCTIDWGDGSAIATGTVTESNGSGTCTGSHTYTTAGNHTIVVTVIDDDGGQGTAQVTIGVFTPRSLKQDAIDRANALIPTASQADKGKLNDVVTEVTASLDPTLWVGTQRLSSTKGQQVFDHEATAMQRLMILLKGTSIPDSSIQPMIDDLLNADKIVAQTAIDDAIAAGGKPAKITQAQTEMSLAASDAAAGQYDTAINDYKAAWKHALAAVS